MKKRITAVALLLVTVMTLCSCSNIINYMFRANPTDGKVRKAGTPFEVMDNCSVEVTVKRSDREAPDVRNYDVNNRCIKRTYTSYGQTHTEYLDLDRTTVLYIENGSGYAGIPSSSKYFPMLLGFNYFGIENLDFSKFEKSADGYVPAKASELNTLAKVLVGNREYDDFSETFRFFTVYIEDGIVERAVLRSEITDGGKNYTAEYTLVFTNYDALDFDPPTNAYLYEDDNSILQAKLAPRAVLIDEGRFFGFNMQTSPKALVVPVEFPDAPFEGDYIKHISDGFSGKLDPEKNGYSVAEFYSLSSSGLFTPTFDVTEKFVLSHNSDYYAGIQKIYADGDSTFTGSDEVFGEVISFLAEKYDLEDYDFHQDGFVDAVYLVYSHAPVQDTGTDNLFWSWESLSAIEEKVDGMYTGTYVWSSYGELYDETRGAGRELCAGALIHETGHMLGLVDLYDTAVGVGVEGGFGGSDMMDSAYGDFSPACKALVGWADGLYVSSGDDAIPGIGLHTFASSISDRGDLHSLEKYTKDGSFIVIFKDPEKRFRGEFLTIDFYTPDGLYGAIGSGEYGYPSASGIRICHCDATEVEGTNKTVFRDYLYNNSDTEHKFLRLVEADGDYAIESGEAVYTGNTDLFALGSSFGEDFKWYDGTPLGMKIVFQYNELTETVYCDITYCD